MSECFSFLVNKIPVETIHENDESIIEIWDSKRRKTCQN